MSAAQTTREAVRRTGRTERFVVVDEREAFHFAYGGYIVVEAPDGQMVDRFRSALAAEYYAVLLNAGVASIDPHAIVGCKVVAAWIADGADVCTAGHAQHEDVELAATPF